MTARNLNCSLRRRRRGAPMQAFDRLPPDLRHWLHAAALPWSAQSVLTLWQRALRDAGGDTSAARQRLDATEARLIARDAARIWGPGHPACSGPERGQPG